MAFSVVACRGGTASRATSPNVPPQWSATARISLADAGGSTISPETTRWISASDPPISDTSTTSTTQPSRSRPLNGTRTRTPGRTEAASSAGTR